MTVTLSQASRDYLVSQGLTPTNTSHVDQAIVDARNAIYNALDFGDPVSKDMVLFYLDAEPPTPSLRDTFEPKLINYFDTLDKPTTEALAPLVSNASWWKATRGGFTESVTQRNEYLRRGLLNGNTDDATSTPKAAPPAEVILTLGNSVDTNGSLAGLTSATRDFAIAHARNYITWAAHPDRRLPISADLIAAYRSLDPAGSATTIRNLLLDTMGSDGTVSADLMAAYREIAPTSGHPSADATRVELANSGDVGGAFWPKPGVDFVPRTPPPASLAIPIQGWAYLAYASLRKQIDAGKEVDAALLGQLESLVPWAGADVRFNALRRQADSGVLDLSDLAVLETVRPAKAVEVALVALNVQVDSGGNLNPEYLKLVARHDAQAAVDLATEHLLNGLQPTNRLLDMTGQPSAYAGIAQGTGVTIRVSLTGMGTRPVEENAIVRLSRTPPTASPVTVNATITEADLARGYIDIRDAGTSPYPGTGTYSYTSSFTSADGTYNSPTSLPVSVRVTSTIDPTAWGSVTPPRGVDMGAWNVLNTVSPAAAQSLWTRYANAGLTPSASTTAPNDGSLSTEELMAMDMETAVQLAMADRAQRVQTQAMQQMSNIQAKNNQIGKMNEVLSALNQLQAGMSAATTTDKVKAKVPDAQWPVLMSQVNTAIGAAGIQLFLGDDGSGTGLLHENVTKGQLDIAIQKVKGDIDSLSNFQQMDMLRLQSLTSRYSECHSLVSGFLEKMFNLHSKIIESIR